jgi:hypothetical protein
MRSKAGHTVDLVECLLPRGHPKFAKRQQGDDEAERKRENAEAARPTRRIEP